MKKAKEQYKLIEQHEGSEATICGDRCTLPDSGNVKRALDILNRLAVDPKTGFVDWRVNSQLVFDFVKAMDFSEEQNRPVTIRNFTTVQDITDFVTATNDFMSEPPTERFDTPSPDRILRHLERNVVYNKLCHHFGIATGNLYEDSGGHTFPLTWFHDYWERYINGDKVVARLVRGIAWKPPARYFEEVLKRIPAEKMEIARIQAI